MTTTELALVNDERYMAGIPSKALELSKRNIVPEAFRGKPENIELSAYALAAVGMELSPTTLPKTYVVKGAAGFYAQLQVALAGRHGCHIVPLDDESDETAAVVKALGKDGEWHRVTFTMEQAVKRGLPARNPNYKSMPEAMLMARACTKAIKYHCPEALLLLPPADRDELDYIDDVDSAEVDRQVPPRSVAPDGHTIPEHLREPAIDDEQRARLVAALDGLPDDQAAQVRGAARELGIPNLRSSRATRAHGALVERLIAEASPAPGATSSAQGREVDTSTGEIIDAEEVPETDQPTLYGPDEEPF